jgi:hypothetical protein
VKYNLKYFGKLMLPVLLAVVGLFGFIGPVVAGPAQSRPSESLERLRTAAVLSTTEIILTTRNSLPPTLKVSNDGNFLTLVYSKLSGVRAVHVKSATLADGWVTTRYLGSGENPRVAFKSGSNTEVFVVWQAADNKSIRFASCTLSLTTQPTCVPATPGGTTVTSITSGNVETPDIVVDSNGAIHVAWVRDLNNIRSVETAVSTNNGQNWVTSSPIQPPVGTGFTTPKLAFANNALHLALRRIANSNNLGAAILYYRTTNLSTPAWTLTKSFQKGVGLDVNFQYDDLANPTIAASGNNIYLAWDAHLSVGSAGNGFGLMRATSLDNGLTWSGVTHITDNNSAATNVQNPPKLFEDASDFAPEIALRPRLTISGSGYALVWQQRPAGLTPGCQEGVNGSAEIYHAYTADNTNWTQDTLADNENEYPVAPDLAVNGNARHFIYIKDGFTESCIGGEAQEYGINYRGPFTNTINDLGEDPTTPATDPNNPNGPSDPPEGPQSGNPNGRPIVYLPVIFK